MYRLRIDRLRELAAEHGDVTRPQIARRTGIAESSIYRYMDATSQPDLNSVLRMASAYDTTVEDLMRRIAEPESVPA